jgi:hypothetical protein
MESNTTTEGDTRLTTNKTCATSQIASAMTLAEESPFVMNWSEFLTYYRSRATWEIISGWAHDVFSVGVVIGPRAGARPRDDGVDALGGLAQRRNCFTCRAFALSIVKVTRNGIKTTICGYCRSRMAIRLDQLAIWCRVFMWASRIPAAQDTITYLRQLVIRAVLGEFDGEIVSDVCTY